MELYKDYLPANARVIVDYTAEEKVKFSYPQEWTYWKAVTKMALPTVISFWLVLHLAIIAKPLIILSVFFLILSITIFPIYLLFNPITMIQPAVEAQTFVYDFWSFFPYFLVVIYFFGLPIMLTYLTALNKQWLSTIVPKFGYWTARLNGMWNEKRFLPEDISENKAIIPAFSNVYLIYEATKDFEKYLTKIEVMELPFVYMTNNFFYPFKRKKKEEKNDMIFSAVFYFSKKPKTGVLKTQFE